MEIHRIGNRLFMIMEIEDIFLLDKKTKMDANNPKMQELKNLMWKYEQALPMAKKEGNRF